MYLLDSLNLQEVWRDNRMANRKRSRSMLVSVPIVASIVLLFLKIGWKVMEDERKMKLWLPQTEYLRGHLRHRFSVLVYDGDFDKKVDI